jgi:hypothetical protein
VGLDSTDISGYESFGAEAADISRPCATYIRGWCKQLIGFAKVETTVKKRLVRDCCITLELFWRYYGRISLPVEVTLWLKRSLKGSEARLH